MKSHCCLFHVRLAVLVFLCGGYITNLKAQDIQALIDAIKAGNEPASRLSQLALGNNPQAQYFLADLYEWGSAKQIPKDPAQAAKWYRKAAENGYAPAQVRMGLRYANEPDKDPLEAVNWYRKAAEQGNPDGQYYLALRYSKGDGVPKNLEEAARWFSKAAEQGDANAQWKLGNMYGKGEGVPRNTGKAIFWIEKTAENNNPYTFNSIGDTFDQGEVLPKNRERACFWYKKAAESSLDIEEAQFNLGRCYLSGIAVPRDLSRGLAMLDKATATAKSRANTDLLFKIAALHLASDGGLFDISRARRILDIYITAFNSKDRPLRQHQLAEAFRSGEGVPKDANQALYWYTQSAEQGFVLAQLTLADLYFAGEQVPKNLTKAAFWTQKAAEQGWLEAQFNMGVTYANGWGVIKDEVEAVKWWRIAAERGHPEAQSNLGSAYYKGFAVPKSLVLSYMWRNLAAAQGNDIALKAREALEHDMSAAQIAEAQRLSRAWKAKK